MITALDLQGLIALAIINNKPAFIQAMNQYGYPVPSTISDAALMEQAMNVWSLRGALAIANILSPVPVNKSKVTQSQADALTARFMDPSSGAKFKDWFNNTVGFFGDLIGGSAISNTVPITQQTTSTPALSPAILALTVVAGIITIAIFRKFTAVVVGIIVIVMGVVLYGIFVKNTSTTASGGGTTTTTHGGIGAALVQGLAHLFGG